MLNPKVRELYSDDAVVMLEKMANEFEKKNIWIGIWGITHERNGGIYPNTILYTNEEKSIYNEVMNYVGEIIYKLSIEEEEYWTSLSVRSGQSAMNIYGEECIPLWVTF
jgi:hypothetical protein